MRTAKVLIYFGILIIFIESTGCRKGEEDPFISLKSRNSRITGYWHLTKIFGHHEFRSDEYFSHFYDANYNINASDRYYTTQTINANGLIIYYEYFDCRMRINEDNTMEVNYRTKGVSYFNDDITGTWAWENESGKNKEFVILDAFAPNVVGYPYRIVKLKDKEMILEVDIDESFVSENGYPTQVVGKYTYEFVKTED